MNKSVQRRHLKWDNFVTDQLADSNIRRDQNRTVTIFGESSATPPKPVHRIQRWGTRFPSPQSLSRQSPKSTPAVFVNRYDIRTETTVLPMALRRVIPNGAKLSIGNLL